MDVKPTQITKKNNLKTILICIAIVIISAGISGFGVWYFMNQHNNTDKKTLTEQITAKESSISDLKKTITNLNSTIASDKASATTTPINPAATDDITTLKAFCISDNSAYTLGNLFYASVPSGVYGGCNIGNKVGVGGFYRITKKINNTWTIVKDTQQETTEFLKANSIPLNVVVTPDAYNLLPN